METTRQTFRIQRSLFSLYQNLVESNNLDKHKVFNCLIAIECMDVSEAKKYIETYYPEYLAAPYKMNYYFWHDKEYEKLNININNDLLELLKAKAKKHNQSLNQMAEYLIAWDTMPTYLTRTYRAQLDKVYFYWLIEIPMVDKVIERVKHYGNQVDYPHVGSQGDEDFPEQERIYQEYLKYQRGTVKLLYTYSNSEGLRSLET